MKLINEQEIYDTWSPIIESKAGITDSNKKEWLTKYCNYHSLNESAGAYNSLGVVNGMGSVAPPLFPGMGSFQGGNANGGFYNTNNQGSGDKFDSLTVGTPAAQNDDKKKKKKRTIQTFMDFSKAMKMLQEK